MNYRVAIVVGCAALAGCEPPATTVNQQVRNRIFMECLRAVPKGPDNTKFNDWAEVVGECETVAYYQSMQVGPAPIRSVP